MPGKNNAPARHASCSLSPVIRGEGWGEGSAAPICEPTVVRVHSPQTPLPPPSPRNQTRGEGVKAAASRANRRCGRLWYTYTIPMTTTLPPKPSAPAKEFHPDDYRMTVGEH